jgi:catechol-2,3-dioxygenase
MVLNHLNLATTDVTGLAGFFTEFAGLTKVGGNAGMAFLSDDHGFILSIMKAKGGIAEYPGTFHVGFFQGDRQSVDELHRKITSAGFEATEPTDSHAYTFYAKAPGGVMVEFGC